MREGSGTVAGRKPQHIVTIGWRKDSMADGKCPERIRRLVFERDGLVCAECGLRGQRKRFPKGGYGYYTDMPGVWLSIDHINPVSLGGTNDMANLRVLCTKCNTKKGRKVEQTEDRAA